MAKPKRRGSKHPKRDIYQEVTNRIVEAIEAAEASGEPPSWVKPWDATGATDHPVSVAGRPYNGVNIILLWLTAQQQGYASNVWCTYKQAVAHGGHVRKGEKGTLVTFWRQILVNDEDKQTGETRKKRIPIVKGYTVFNLDQTEDVKLPKRTAKLCGDEREARLSEEERFTQAERFLAETGAEIVHGGARACYQIELDRIRLPDFDRFEEPGAYYGTALHESGHWSGAEHRLNRTFGTRFGDDAYAFEELVAEWCAAFLCASLGISRSLQHPEYLGNWARVLKGDKRAVFTAASKARQASEYLLNLTSFRVADESDAEIAEAA